MMIPILGDRVEAMCQDRLQLAAHQDREVKKRRHHLKFGAFKCAKF